LNPEARAQTKTLKILKDIDRKRCQLNYLLSYFDELLILRVEELLVSVLVESLAPVLAHIEHFGVNAYPLQVPG